jgi:flagellar hook assembly protein FlgD
MQGTLLRKEYFVNLQKGVNNISLIPTDKAGNQLPKGSYIFRIVSGKDEGMAKGIVF